MRALAVVVLDVVAKNTLKMASPCDQQPVETLLAHAANETLGVGVRLWRADRCVDDADPLAAEHLVEGGVMHYPDNMREASPTQSVRQMWNGPRMLLADEARPK